MILTKKKRHNILLLMCCITLLSVTYCSIKGILTRQVINSYQKKIVNVQSEIKEDEARLEGLENELQQIDSLEYIEKVAQDRLGLVKSDAVIIKKKNTP